VAGCIGLLRELEWQETAGHRLRGCRRVRRQEASTPGGRFRKRIHGASLRRGEAF
jgi:hypothetical protein